MRLAISNLAWSPEEDRQVAALLGRCGVDGIELAPTKNWSRPLEAPAADVRGCRRFWQDHGIQVVALQALLFGRPDLTLFKDADTRQATFDYLAGMCRLAGELGAGSLVFGSPRNRALGALAAADALTIAAEFFGLLAVVARGENVTFCLEPNPAVYQCDFITTAAQAAQLVRTVNDPGFGLHLDTACLALSGEEIDPSLCQHGALVRHFHISEPYLHPVDENTVDHARLGGSLRRSGYAHWISIEMQRGEQADWMARLERSVRFVQECYLSSSAHEISVDRVNT